MRYSHMHCGDLTDKKGKKRFGSKKSQIIAFVPNLSDEIGRFKAHVYKSVQQV